MVGGYLIFYEFSGEDDKTAVKHINVYISQLGFAGKEDYMRIRNFPLSLIGIAFAWFTSLPWCTIDSWSQLEEKFYEFFGKTNEKKSITIKTLAKAGLLDSQKASLTTEKHEKHQKSARLDFSGAKGPVYLSSDYYVISEDQVPAKKNEALPACSKVARPTAHAACPVSARPTTRAASHESARLTLMPTKSSASTASAQIGLSRFLWFLQLPMHLWMIRHLLIVPQR
jgi:hypothetical protein